MGHCLPVAWFQGQLEGHPGPPDSDSWYQLRFGKLLAVDSLPQNSQVRTGAWACRAHPGDSQTRGVQEHGQEPKKARTRSEVARAARDLRRQGASVASPLSLSGG